MFAPHKVLRNLCFSFLLRGSHSTVGNFRLSLSRFTLPPPSPKKKKNSKQPVFLAGCQHLIRTLLLVIEVFRGEIKGNAHVKVLGSKRGVQMANSVMAFQTLTASFSCSFSSLFQSNVFTAKCCSIKSGKTCGL